MSRSHHLFVRHLQNTFVLVLWRASPFSPTAAPFLTSSFSLVPMLNIWRLESHCLLSGNISAAYLPLEKGEEDKGGDGKNTPCCVNPGEGLEPCHSSLSLHQLSLIATEDRIPRAQLFLILFGASEAWKAKGLLLIFFLLVFFYPSTSPSVILCYLSTKRETLFSNCAPFFSHAKIIIKLCFIK